MEVEAGCRSLRSDDRIGVCMGRLTRGWVWAACVVSALASSAGCAGSCDGSAHDGANAGGAKESAAAMPAGPAWREGYGRPRVLDVHAHIMPSGLERMAEIMRDNGLAIAVNLSGGSFGRGLEISEAMAQRLPGLINFYTPNWRGANLPDFGETRGGGAGARGQGARVSRA